MRTGTGSFNGLAFGPGTPFPITRLEGVLDAPGIRTRDLDRAEQHGSTSLPDYAQPRVVVLGLGVIADDQLQLGDLEVQLQAAFPVGQADVAALYLLDSSKVVFGKVRRRAIPQDAARDWRINDGVLIQVECPDPRLYDALETAASVGLPAAINSGTAWPLQWPISFGASDPGGQATVVNTGNTDAYPVLTISGPITNPTVLNVTTGEQLALTYELPAGDTLVIDTQARTVLLGGTANRRDALDPGSQWPRLLPGPNTLQFRGVYTETVADAYSDGYADTYGGSSPPLLNIRFRSGSL